MRGEMPSCIRKNPPHERKAVPPAGERQARLVSIFQRESAYRAGINVRWIGDDEVVAEVIELREHI